MLNVRNAHTHTQTHLSLLLLHPVFSLPPVLNLTFRLALPLWSGLLQRAPITGTGTGESRSVWLRRMALAQGLISRPSTLPTLSPQRSCNKTSQIWRLRKTATAQMLWSWLAETRIWTLKKASWLMFKNYTGSCVVVCVGFGEETGSWLFSFFLTLRCTDRSTCEHFYSCKT